MTTFDDGTPVQPGRYRMTMDVEVREGQGGTYVFALKCGANLGDLDYGVAAGATFESLAEPRPPLPTQLGAVVWVDGMPFLLGRRAESLSVCQWFDYLGERVNVAWLAEQDWTTTPPEAS